MVMTRRALLLCGLSGVLSLLAGCGVTPREQDVSDAGTTTEVAKTLPPATGGEEVDKFALQIGGKSFLGRLALTDAGAELASRMPLKLTMKEHNGNEKYWYTGREFPGAPQKPNRLSAGELWAFSGDCLVLFYEDHANDGYEYVYLGRLDDATGLADALGTGDVEVSFV